MESIHSRRHRELDGPLMTDLSNATPVARSGRAVLPPPAAPRSGTSVLAYTSADDVAVARFSPKAAGCIFHPEAKTQGTASPILIRFIMGRRAGMNTVQSPIHTRTAGGRVGLHQRLDEPAELPPPGSPVRLDHKCNARFDPLTMAQSLFASGPSPRVSLGLIDRRLSRHGCQTHVIPADTNTYRVVNGEGDGLGGLIVDRYDDTLVLRLYSAAWVPHLDTIVSCLSQRPETSTILRRFGVRRVDGREGAETLHGPGAREPLVVREAGLQFLARPMTGQRWASSSTARASHAPASHREARPL